MSAGTYGTQNRDVGCRTDRMRIILLGSIFKCGPKRQPAPGLARARICPWARGYASQQRAHASHKLKPKPPHMCSAQPVWFIGHRGHPQVLICVRLLWVLTHHALNSGYPLTRAATGRVSFTPAAGGQHAPHSAYSNEEDVSWQTPTPCCF